MQHLVVVRGDAAPATAALASSLGGDLLVWDEADHHERWRDRPGTFEVRAHPLAARAGRRFGPGAEQRVRNAVVRAYLARRRRVPIIEVGRGALGIASWLGHHRGRRCWVPTTDDVPAIAGGLDVPLQEVGGPNVVAVVGDLCVEHDALAPIVDQRWRWLPGWRADVGDDGPGPADDGATGRRVLAFGTADREGGLDHVGRTLAAARAATGRNRIEVTWLVPAYTEIATEEVDDLRRAGVEHLITFLEGIERHETADHPAVSQVGAVLLLDREPKGPDAELLLTRAYRRGARFVATDRWAAPSPGLDRAWSTVPLGDARAAATTLAAALDDATTYGPPGPFGPLGLFEDPR